MSSLDRWRYRLSIAALTPVVLFATACSGRQSALDPAGRYADDIARLWWIFFGVCTAVYLLVLLFLLIAMAKRRREPTEELERRLAYGVGTSIALTIAILFVLLFFSTTTGNALMTTDKRPSMKVEITAQQWWWQVEYYDPVPSRRFVSSNELYLPVGRPVELVLKSTDVIHSLWIPNIHGKRDLIPGHDTSFVVQADRLGKYDGQCAEFCGLQHAKMRLAVTALSQQDFDRWADAQRKPAREPLTIVEQKGQQVFLAGSCPMCHTINGTPAQGKKAPDLTHIASRPMIAANSVPNVTGHLAGWILDPQTVKPGNYMPPNALAAEDLHALLAYLRSLK